MDLSNGKYSDNDIFSILSSATRTVYYRYVVADPQNKFLGEISISDGKISYDSEANVKRTLTGTVEKSDLLKYDSVDFCIIPYFCLLYKKEEIKWPLGKFIIDTSFLGSDFIGRTKFKGYDLGKVVLDNKTTNRFLANTGGIYVTYIKQLLGECNVENNIVNSDKTKPSPDEWGIGTSYLEIINTLLNAIGYDELVFSEDGTAISKEYELPQSREPERYYTTTERSVILDDVSVDTNVFDIPNKIVRYTESVDSEYMISVYQDDSEDSPYSTVNRGRTIVDSQAVKDIASQADLDNLVRKISIETRQSTNVLTFYTLNIPCHGFRNCLNVAIPQYDIAGKYIETAWEMELWNGGRMMHRCERVVEM